MNFKHNRKKFLKSEKPQINIINKDFEIETSINYVFEDGSKLSLVCVAPRPSHDKMILPVYDHSEIEALYRDLKSKSAEEWKGVTLEKFTEICMAQKFLTNTKICDESNAGQARERLVKQISDFVEIA